MKNDIFKKTPMKAGKCEICLCGKGRLWTMDGKDITNNLLALPGGKTMVKKMIEQHLGQEAVKHFLDKLYEKKKADTKE